MYSLIDHTQLSATATEDDIDQACWTAEEYGCASVCIPPRWVSHAVAELQGTGIPVCTVIGFPTGAVPTSEKVAEARKAVADGALELDMVINLDAVRDDDWDKVIEDIMAVRDVDYTLVLKVILETATLTDDQIIRACEASRDGGANFVKTSTGMHPAGGATVHAVALMRQTVPQLGVKASGGVRTAEQAEAMVTAGANRIGTSGTANF